MDKQVQWLQQNLDKRTRQIFNAAMKGIQEGAIKVLTDAKLIAPVDTGLLRKSLLYRKIKSSDTSARGYEVGTNVEYAPFQEFGTSRMEPQPFLKPALDGNRENILLLVRRRIQQELS